jgi:regulator of sigma E protease
VSLQDLWGVGGSLIKYAAIAGMFLLLVGPHEAGHFALAKLFGVRVHEFSIGMGTRIWSGVRSGTLYALRVLPLGGYVRLAGMEPGDYDAPDGFHSKPAYQRLLILAAGPAVNFLVAGLIVTGITMTQLNNDPGKVDGVFANSPAAAQGIRDGDSIRAIDGRPIQRPEDIHNTVDATPGTPHTYLVRRPDGSTFTATVTAVPGTFTGDPNDRKRLLIGVKNHGLVTPLDAIWTGVRFPVVATGAIAAGVYEVISGTVPGGLLGPSGVSGPIGFGYIAYNGAGQGAVYFLSLVALLSMALGLTNLLPVPALDGGRMLVVLLEKLRGRPFDRARAEAVQRAGLVALLALMVLIAFLDVQRIASGQFPGPR